MHLVASQPHPYLWMSIKIILFCLITALQEREEGNNPSIIESIIESFKLFSFVSFHSWSMLESICGNLWCKTERERESTVVCCWHCIATQSSVVCYPKEDRSRGRSRWAGVVYGWRNLFFNSRQEGWRGPCSHRPCSCCSRNVQRPPAAVRLHRSSTSAASSNSQSSSF